MANVYIDTETCGFHGMPVIIQYAYDDGPIQIWNFWLHPIYESLNLIEELCKHTIIGFNLAFDWFHINKVYNVFAKATDYLAWPIDIIDELADIEPEARFGLCVKPAAAFDLMLHARKTKYQSTMNRGDISIRRVPKVLAWKLAEHLEKALQISDIHFARRKDKYAPKWKVKDIKGVDDFKEVCLSFKASSSLKALAVDALGVSPDLIKFQDVSVPSQYNPIEAPYAPFARAITTRENRWHGTFYKGKKKFVGFTWPGVIKFHIDHWETHPTARQYAANDIQYTRDLYKYFDCPDTNDNDSVLACAVAAVRWKGFSINIEAIKKLREKAIAKAAEFPTSPSKAKVYITQALSEVEKLILENNGGSTKKVVLEELAKQEPEPCICTMNSYSNKVSGLTDCTICDGKGLIKSEASIRAKNVLDARMAKKEIEIYDKLLLAGRFHFSVSVIGTLSSRMAGTDGLNPQGIKRTNDVRSSFTFADPGFDFRGGDFAGFEVVLADAAYDDAELRNDLLTCDKCGGKMQSNNGPPICTDCGSKDGKKIHALLGIHFFPHLDYKGIKASKGQEMDYYERSKHGVFALLYGGNADTLARKVGIPLEDGQKGERRFMLRYPGVAKARTKIFDSFCSMRQPGGIGSRVEWHEPAEYIESLFGFRRYFTLENLICKTLFQLANKPPEEWKKYKMPVIRRDRVQTAGGALQSALYAAAFGIQASNMRAAANHVIQSSGAQITKDVQRHIWDLQPTGVNPWIVQPCNVHDEVLCPTSPAYVEKVDATVHETVESYRSKVPLIVMEWGPMTTWADK